MAVFKILKPTSEATWKCPKSMRTYQKCSAEPEALLAGGSRTCKCQRKAASGESPERWSLHAAMSSFTIKAKQRSIPKHANTDRTHMPADKIKKIRRRWEAWEVLTTEESQEAERDVRVKTILARLLQLLKQCSSSQRGAVNDSE